MEKLMTLLWILFGIGAFVFRMIQKARETAATEARERPNRPHTPAPALPNASFQELLKQMQARNAGETAETTSQPAYPAPGQERTPGGRALPQQASRPALSQERTTFRPKSLEVATPVARRNTGLSRIKVASAPAAFPAYAAPGQPGEPVNRTVRGLLANPANVRAAVVLSEILQRRHF
jgi:hypothetical protein